MDLDEIISILDYSTMRVVRMRKQPQIYNGLVYLSDPASSALVITPESLCFGTASQFNMIPEASLSGGTFLLALDEPVKQFAANVTLITFGSKQEQRSCYDQMAREFRDLRKVKDGLFGLTSMVSRGRSLTMLVNRVSSLFEAPVNLLDNSLSITAHSDYFPDYIADGQEASTSFLPEAAQAKMKEEGLVNRPPDESVHVFTWESDGVTCYNHFTPIRVGNVSLGSISLFTQRHPLRPSRIELLPALAQILSIDLQKDSTYLLNKSAYYSHLITDLVNGRITESPDALEYRFSIFGYPMKRYKRIVHADLSREYFDMSQAQTFASQMHRALPNSLYVIDSQSITLLLGGDDPENEDAYDTAVDQLWYCDGPVPDDPVLASILTLPSIVEGTSIRIGVSCAFENILQAPTYLSQAKRAIAVGQHFGGEDPLYFYSHFRMADVIDHVDLPRALYSFRHPPLMLVIREDARRNTKLSHTLYEYLKSPSRPQDVCERLFIHKNTLYYRLDRIKEIMGVDLHNGWVVAQVELTFIVLMHQGKFEELVLREK